MAKYLGKEMTKKELMSRVGDMSQIARISDYRYESGREEGMRGLEVVNGGGLQFTVLPSRGMDIAQATYKGIPLAFISKAGLSSPAFFEKDGLSFLRNFTCGLLTTCGLTYMGAPCVDQGEPLGLHGRVSNIPAGNCGYTAAWEGDDYVLTMKGQVREGGMFGDNMVLDREITTKLGSNSIHIKDVVTNEGFADTPFMLLYHCNFGYPLVDKNTTLEADINSVRGRDPRADEGINEYKEFVEPVPGFTEQVYYLDPKAGEDGMTAGSLINPDLLANGLKVTVKASKETLPMMGEWKQMGEGDYVVGIEPCNWLPEGRAKARELGELTFLKPGESKVMELDIIIEEL